MNRQVNVHLDDFGRVGVAFINHTRSGVTTVFHYETDYLRNPRSYAIDPSLPLVTGGHGIVGLPGAMQDGAPDRWGRNLIRKRAQAVARRAGTPVPNLTDDDFLLGVSDQSRQGALRYRLSDEGVFESNAGAVPKLVALRRLQSAARRIASDPEDNAALKELLDAGSGSLGGARPKASVVGPDGGLALAKFAQPGDDWEVIAWEKVALDIAERAGVTVPGRDLYRIDDHPCLVLDRFDRRGEARIPYASAMTLLEARDGEEHDYADILEGMDEAGVPQRDNAELFRRVVLSVAINNTDDHLRNHGFLRTESGWELGPVFDINPNLHTATQRVTSVMGATGGEELDALEDLAEEASLEPAEARAIVGEVTTAVSQWRQLAQSAGVSESEVGKFQDTFEQHLAALEKLARPRPGAPLPASVRRDPQAQPRRPRGTSRGGQFAPKSAVESDVTLDS